MSVNQYKRFDAVVPADFARKMVLFWREDENSTEDQVLASYYDDKFKRLAERLAGARHTFEPDLGYVDPSINGTLCFEVVDNNVVIPVGILEVCP